MEFFDTTTILDPYGCNLLGYPVLVNNKKKSLTYIFTDQTDAGSSLILVFFSINLGCVRLTELTSVVSFLKLQSLMGFSLL